MPSSQYNTIYNWKRYGLLHDDYNGLYETYKNTTHCTHCNTKFKNTRDRHMDHDHSTGLFRKIVCRACNNQDRYIKYPDGYDPKKYHKEYYEANRESILKYYETNRERILKKNKETYTCGCGLTLTINGKARHERSMKHKDWFMNNIY